MGSEAGAAGFAAREGVMEARSFANIFFNMTIEGRNSLRNASLCNLHIPGRPNPGSVRVIGGTAELAAAQPGHDGSLPPATGKSGPDRLRAWLAAVRYQFSRVFSPPAHE